MIIKNLIGNYNSMIRSNKELEGFDQYIISKDGSHLIAVGKNGSLIRGAAIVDGLLHVKGTLSADSLNVGDFSVDSVISKIRYLESESSKLESIIRRQEAEIYNLTDRLRQKDIEIQNLWTRVLKLETNI